MMTSVDFDELFDNELHLAVRVGDVEGAKTALADGCDPNGIGLFEWSALHEASHNGNLKMLKLLLKHNGDPNQKDFLNGSTSLHYAASEGHPKCLDFLLSNGGDVTIKNERGLTVAQITRHKGCKDMLAKHDIEVTTSVHFEDTSPTKAECNSSHTKSMSHITYENTAILPPSSPVKNYKTSTYSQASNESGIGSRTSLSDTASITDPMCHSPDMRERAKSSRPKFQSPSKSISSFGSLTSIGSSIISGSDDCGGYIKMAFQYNSKTGNFKVRITEIVLTCLLSCHEVKKDTTLNLQVEGKIYNPNEVLINRYQTTCLHGKSHPFRLQSCGNPEKPVQDKDGNLKTFWRERDAQIKFSSSLFVEFTNVTKEIVKDSAIQLSVGAKQKKNLLAKNSNHLVPFATLEMPLQEVVKRLMNETYELQQCHVEGVTRPQNRLDQVVSETKHNDTTSSSFTGYSSDPNIRVSSYSSLNIDDVDRSASETDLHRVLSDNTTVLQASCSYEMTSLSAFENDNTVFKAVKTHSVPASPQIKVKIPHNAPSGKDRLESISSCDSSFMTRNDVKMELPMVNTSKDMNPSHSISQNLLKKTGHRMHGISTGGTKSLHRLVVSRNQTDVEIIQLDEENSLGTPPEQIELKDFNISTSVSKENMQPQTSLVEDKNEVVKTLKKSHGLVPRRAMVKSHCRTLSNDSFTKVNESPQSPSRQHRTKKVNERKTRFTRLENHSREYNINKDKKSVLVYDERSLKNDIQAEDNPCYIRD